MGARNMVDGDEHGDDWVRSLAMLLQFRGRLI